MTTESYSYSLDGETFYDRYSTRKEAIDEGDADAHAAHVSGEDTTSFYTARNVSVFDVLRKHPSLTGLTTCCILCDRLEDYLVDGALQAFTPKPSCPMSESQVYEALGTLVIDFLEEHTTIEGGAIRDVEEHPFVA